jgi:hypothetical protein
VKKFIATLLSLTVLIQITPTVSAKPKGNWNSVIALTNHSIAVETTSGETHYGLLQSAADAVIVVQIAGADDFTAQAVSFTARRSTKSLALKVYASAKRISLRARGWVRA